MLIYKKNKFDSATLQLNTKYFAHLLHFLKLLEFTLSFVGPLLTSLKWLTEYELGLYRDFNFILD